MKPQSLSGILLTFLFQSSILIGQNSGEFKSGCLSCEELKNLKLPEVWGLTTETVQDKTTYCRLLGVIGKEINFELLLPEDWNQRFVMGGGGGFVGSIQNAARYKVHEGYATVGTDTGHKGAGIKADWGYHQMERQLNYGHLAVHRTVEVAKVIIGLYYCQSPLYNYFIGCSRGGGQAMHEAQRYPSDFDGIVAAAPVISFTATAAEFIQNSKALYPDPANLTNATISANHVAMLQEAVLAQCDILDGVKDRIINDPEDCDFDLGQLPICDQGKISDQCFSPRQIEVVRLIYAGVENQGFLIYPGFPVGCENEPGSWMNWIVGPDPGSMQLNFPNLHFGFGTELCKYLIFNDSTWDYSRYNLSDYWKETRYAAAYLDATSTDYTAFREGGGKIIFYHGWNDPALSARTTIQHYEALRQADDQYHQFSRLYLLPGVLHCGGGPGPDQADWLEIVRDWVENGMAPEKIVLTKREKGEIKITRPVFPYPSTTHYDGVGDAAVERSFYEKKN